MPKYQKYVQHRKKYKVHDPGNTAKVGDKVVIIEETDQFLATRILKNRNKKVIFKLLS
jgi:ribosomal protein S17